MQVQICTHLLVSCASWSASWGAQASQIWWPASVSCRVRRQAASVRSRHLLHNDRCTHGLPLHAKATQSKLSSARHLPFHMGAACLGSSWGRGRASGRRERLCFGIAAASPVSRSGTLSMKSVCTSARSMGLLPKSRFIVDSSCTGGPPSLAAVSAAPEGEAGVWGSAAAAWSGGTSDSSVESASSLVVTIVLLPARQ